MVEIKEEVDSLLAESIEDRRGFRTIVSLFYMEFSGYIDITRMIRKTKTRFIYAKK